jgi:hypothetical protein
MRPENRDRGDILTYHFASSADDPDAPRDAAVEPLELDVFDWEGLDDWDIADGGVEYVELEHSELDSRLRNLVWPAPPPEVRQRCFEAVLQAALVGACPSAPPVHPERPTGRRRTRASEQVQRYELTRRRFETPALRVPRAPRREPRFAAVL